MFKIDKQVLQFALSLTSKALAQRKQEEIIYRSIRITTFKDNEKYFVMFSSNGGYNSINMAAISLEECNEEMDILIECQKLQQIVEKCTVESLIFEVLENETVLVVANGENKLKFLSGGLMPESVQYEESKSLVETTVENFVNVCKKIIPFSTIDVHKGALIGICIDKNKMYASDEFKAMTIKDIGFEINTKLSFNPIALDMVEMFKNEAKIKFYLGMAKEAIDFSHLVLVVDNMELIVSKYQVDYPSEIIEQVNRMGEDENKGHIFFDRLEILQVLDRISIFLDDNDIVSITPIIESGKEKLILEVLTTKTGEIGKEVVNVSLKLDRGLLGKSIYLSLINLRVMLEGLNEGKVDLSVGSDKFVMAKENNKICWITVKNI